MANTPLDLIEVSGICMSRIENRGSTPSDGSRQYQRLPRLLGILNGGASGSIGLGTFSFGNFDLRLAAGSGPGALPTTINPTVLGQLAAGLRRRSQQDRRRRRARCAAEPGEPVQIPAAQRSHVARAAAVRTGHRARRVRSAADRRGYTVRPEIGPIWPIPPVSIVVGGKVGLTLNMGFGFDTVGLRDFATSGDAEDLINGFYVADKRDLKSSLREVSPRVRSAALSPALHHRGKDHRRHPRRLKLDLNDAAGSTGQQ